ncbi:hypothetical protein CCONF_05215 [Corynebacterium confusum]|nr:hypothetical protein CCONF_05215 [Corynebacterium confusum]
MLGRMDTPNSVAADLVNAPLVNVVYCRNLPAEKELAAAMRDTFGDQLSPLKPGPSPELQVAQARDCTITFKLVDAAPDLSEVEPHPELNDGSVDVSSAASYLLVTVFPDNAHLERGKKYREDRLRQINMLSVATLAALKTPGALAALVPRAGVTISAPRFIQLADSGELAMTAVGVWVRPSEDADRWYAYSVGLIQAGHPEVQIRNAPGEPNDFYAVLRGLVSYVLDGNTVRAGDSLTIVEERPAITVAEDRWVVDPQLPALRLDVA